jgi:hypothetical protein
MLILTKKTVTMRGKDIPPGEVIEVDDQSGAALIREETGAEVRPDAETAAALNVEGVKTGDQDDEAAAKAAEFEKIREAIDGQYKRDELAEAAKSAGVEFAYDAKKGEIIQAVIDQDKVAAILK